MGWRVFGEPFATADLASGLRVFQPVIFNKNIVLKACRAWFIVYNNPTFTDLSMAIYSNSAGAPKKLLHTSTNAITKATMCTLTNGVKEVYFEFNYPVFNSTDTYHFVPRATGYTGSDSSHLAWRAGFPDPVYRTNVDSSYTKLGVSPYCLYFIGDDL